jgi:phosphoribosylformylglycinamidine synthase
VVAVAPGAEAEFARLCAERGVPAETIGTVGGPDLDVTGCFTVPLDELARAHAGPLPAIFGPASSAPAVTS